MALPDKHDKRLFRHYAKTAQDGTVVAIIEVAINKPAPVDDDTYHYIDVTNG